MRKRYFYVIKPQNFLPLRENKGKLRIPYGKGFGSEFAYGKGFGQTPPPHPQGGGVHSYALWESKKLKPMLMGKDLAKHPPTPGGGIKVTW